jgi:hypothetical protein
MSSRKDIGSNSRGFVWKNTKHDGMLPITNFVPGV